MNNQSKNLPHNFGETFAGLFDNEYTNLQIEWYGKGGYENDGVEIVIKKLSGRCDQYLHKSFEVGDLEVPVMDINGELWMSLTPMEIQSAGYALSQVGGDVGTAGLGMGYFALSAAMDDDVDKVDVYEIDENVIRYFRERFSDREGFEKINIIHGDVREKCTGMYYDVFFNDIYQSLLPDEIITDIDLFTFNNEINQYLFWGYELALYAASQQGLIIDVSPTLRDYYREFFKDDRRASLAKTGWDLPDEEYIERLMEVIYETKSICDSGVSDE